MSWHEPAVRQRGHVVTFSLICIAERTNVERAARVGSQPSPAAHLTSKEKGLFQFEILPMQPATINQLISTI
jgi:hypothetical protein